MARSRVAGLAARLAAEFRADWSDRQKALDADIQQSSSAFAVQGLSRSGPLLKEHARLLEQALDDARSLLIRRASLLLAGIKAGAQYGPTVARLREVVAAELTRLATEFDQLLTREAQSMGLGTNLGENVQSKRKALLTTLDSELVAALTASQRNSIAHTLPWYQRPLGYVLLTALAGVLVWLAIKVFSL